MIRLRHLGAVLCLAASSACGPVSLSDGGTACPVGTVDTGGGCALRRPLGQGCSAGTACESGYCTDGVCCNQACAGPCVTCDHSGTCVPVANLAPEAVCGAYVCGAGKCLTTCTLDNQCAADAHCESRQCVAARGNGAFCTADNQCQGKHCVDGFCCENACSGPCDSCGLSGKEGKCSTVAAGTAGSPSCGSFLCDGVNPVCPAGCASDSQCTTGRYCDLQGSCSSKRAIGTQCSDGRECLTGFCADGFCCDTACNGGCDTCNAAGDEGTCRLSAAGAPGSPTCTPLVCTGAVAACPSSCANDFQCIAGRFCSAGGCQLQKSNGLTCTEGRECTSGFCADGVCCNSACGAQCDACNQLGTVGQCTLMPLSQPGNPACAPYSCNGVTVNCGLACTAIGPGAPCASNEWCDGVACAKRGSPGATCTLDYHCLSGNCVDGVCCNTTCKGSCDSCNLRAQEGTCLPSPAGTVSAACGNYTCDGATTSCPAACTTDANCIPGLWCDGSLCVPKRAQGQVCTTDSSCTSGHCADGFCCDGVCGNACDVCNLLGEEGTCSTAPAGSNPGPSCGRYVCDGLGAGCPASCNSDAQCRQDAWCNAGTCEPRRPNGHPCSKDRTCMQSHCSDGVCCDETCSDACDSCGIILGTCLALPQGAAGGPTCNPYVCDGTNKSCPQSCNLDADCAGGSYCTGPGGVCATKQPDGTACGTSDSVCISGHCADGFCCNATCNGACEACDSNPGTCTAYLAGNVGLPACGATVCNGVLGSCPASCPGTPTLQTGCAAAFYCVSGTCTAKKALGTGCFDATECGSGFCADGVCCNTGCGNACDACNLTPGTCTPALAAAAGSPTCFPFACNGTLTTCPTTCATNGDCASNVCTTSVCQKRALGVGCAASFECASSCCDQTSSQCAAGPTNCL